MRYDCLIIDDEKLLADSTAEYFNLFGVSTAAVYSVSQCRELMGVLFEGYCEPASSGYQLRGRQRF